MKHSYVLASVLLLGSGCANLRTDLSARQTSIGLEEQALINNLRIAYDPCVASAASSETCPRLRTPSTDAASRAQHVLDVGVFLDAGYTLSDYYCDIFLRQTNRGARHRRHGRSLTNDTGGAIAAVLGLARAGSGVVGGVAAGFSFADSQFRNYDDSFLVTADLAKMRTLVLAAQDNMKLAVEKDPPTNFFRAESVILRYAGLCSFLGMQDLLNASVDAKTATIQDDNEKQINTASAHNRATDPPATSDPPSRDPGLQSDEPATEPVTTPPVAPSPSQSEPATVAPPVAPPPPPSA